MRHRKTDKIDAEILEQTQYIFNRKPSYVQEEIFERLRDLSRFYQNLTEDVVRAKNNLHKVLQATFPEIEKILSSPTGVQYWKLVLAFPSSSIVLKISRPELEIIIRQSTVKWISEKRVITLTEKLKELAKPSYLAVALDSPMLEMIRYYEQDLLRLNVQRQAVLNTMIVQSHTLSVSRLFSSRAYYQT